MAQSTEISDAVSVIENIKKLESKLSEMAEVLRQIILSIYKEMGERIKWNHPSFFYLGSTKPLYQKDYKKEIVGG